MKGLNKRPRIEDYYFIKLSREFNIEFSKMFIDFLKKYSRTRPLENKYSDLNSNIFTISEFISGNDMQRYAKGIFGCQLGLKIPFAVGLENQFYCISLDKDTYNEVFLFTLTGAWNDIKGYLEKVSDSFYDFINNLQESIDTSNYKNLIVNSFQLKELTIKSISDNDFSLIEKKIGVTLPSNYKSFMKKYSDTSVYEDNYRNDEGELFLLGSFSTLTMINDRVDEYLAEKDFFKDVGLYIPIGIDPGGYYFVLSLSNDTYGKIFFLMEELIDSNLNEAFQFLANSFEEFIDGLQPEAEV